MGKCTCLQGSNHVNRLKKVKKALNISHKCQRILDLARAFQITANPLML